jgi:hypothetical protein
MLSNIHDDVNIDIGSVKAAAMSFSKFTSLAVHNTSLQETGSKYSLSAIYNLTATLRFAYAGNKTLFIHCKVCRGYHVYCSNIIFLTLIQISAQLEDTDYGEYSRTFLCDSVSMKLPRLRLDFVERVRRTDEVRSPPSFPPRQKKMVARKKHAIEAHAKPIRYRPM